MQFSGWVGGRADLRHWCGVNSNGEDGGRRPGPRCDEESGGHLARPSDDRELRDRRGRPAFWSLLTFARGGTLTETTANQALPAPRTPGHGVWGWTGPSSFFAASEAFLLFGPGFARWTQRIEQTIVMTSDDEFDSDARVILSVTPSHLQPAQNPPPAPGCARARGYRF